METPYPEELSDLPTPPPGRYCRAHTHRAIKECLALVHKKRYATNQLVHYKNKIQQLELQIQMLEKRVTYYDDDIVEAKKKAKRYLDDDLEDYEDDQE